MTLKMYDLAGAEADRRFSPYCWRITMAAAHKGIDLETVPWRFLEKDAIAASGQGAVPVLQDGEKMIADSWDIACYLEEKYPDQPTLFGGQVGKAEAKFIKYWAERVVMPAMVRIIILDVASQLHEDDRPYFVETRSKRFGMPLEEFADDSVEQVKALYNALTPARQTLGDQDYLCGDKSGFADYILFGLFQWARCTSPKTLLDADDPVFAWRDRMLKLFDGLAAKAKGYAVA